MTKTLTSAALVAIAAVTATPMASADIRTFNVTISGLQEVPPNPSPGTGSATVTIDTVTRLVQVNGTFTGMTAGCTAGHLHGLAGPGASAGVIFGFTVSTGATTGNFSGSSVLSVANFNGLMNGMTYLNIHSSAFPGGELRGQVIVPAPGDLNQDGVVDGNDLAIVLGGWGPCAGCVADITDDGVVDGNDLAVVLGGWS